MFYFGQTDPENPFIGLATSSDLVSWTKYPLNPLQITGVTGPTGVSGGTVGIRPDVFQVNGVWTLLYDDVGTNIFESTLSSQTDPIYPPADQISSFTFGASGESDVVGTSTINVTVPYGTSVVNLAPTVGIPIGATMSPSAGTGRNFTSPQTYTVTATDGVSTQQYTVAVSIAPSADATLSNLTIGQGTLSPSFSPGTTSYADSVANSISNLVIMPTATQASSTITVDGNTVSSGSSSGSISLNVGSNTITIAVTAPNGTALDTYTVVVTRAGAAQASLGANGAPAGSFGSKTVTGPFLVPSSASIAPATATLSASQSPGTTGESSIPSLLFTQNLELHDISPEVLVIQQFLNAHGFLLADTGPGSPGLETSIFGPKTYRALVQFQRANRLPSTGFFGPLTQATIGRIEYDVRTEATSTEE
jgi:hypothetical protein